MERYLLYKSVNLSSIFGTHSEKGGQTPQNCSLTSVGVQWHTHTHTHTLHKTIIMMIPITLI